MDTKLGQHLTPTLLTSACSRPDFLGFFCFPVLWKTSVGNTRSSCTHTKNGTPAAGVTCQSCGVARTTLLETRVFRRQGQHSEATRREPLARPVASRLTLTLSIYLPAKIAEEDSPALAF